MGRIAPALDFIQLLGCSRVFWTDGIHEKKPAPRLEHTVNLANKALWRREVVWRKSASDALERTFAKRKGARLGKAGFDVVKRPRLGLAQTDLEHRAGDIGGDHRVDVRRKRERGVSRSSRDVQNSTATGLDDLDKPAQRVRITVDCTCGIAFRCWTKDGSRVGAAFAHAIVIHAVWTKLFPPRSA